MRQWDAQQDRYMVEYSARGLSAERVQSVERELSRLGGWLKRRRPRPNLEAVDASLLQHYLSDRCAFRSKATLAQVMGIVRGMGEHLVHEGLWTQNPLRWMRGPKVDPRAKVPRRLGRTGMQRLWAEAASHRFGYHRHVWLAVLGLLYGTGLRRGELSRLDLAAYDSEQGLLLIDGRKSGWQRQAVLPELTRRCLEAYLPQRHNHLERLGRRDQHALLVDQFGGRLSGQAISRGLQRLALRADLPHLTLHQFRHSCASDLLESGVRLPEVQQVLGHRTIQTTVRYLHIADPQRHKAVALHPINQMLAPHLAATEGGAA